MKQLIDCLKIGDKVFDILEGWGVVTYLDEDSISVQFNNTGDDYEPDGRKFESDINPSLFLHEMTLEQELPEFIEGEIVLVSNAHKCSSWIHIGKYVKYDSIKNEHIVDLLNYDFSLDYRRNFKYCKSFDKSHFTK
jgi:hypothetical protein